MEKNRREMSIRRWRRIERQGEEDNERGTREVGGSEKYRNMRTGKKNKKKLEDKKGEGLTKEEKKRKKKEHKRRKIRKEVEEGE
jgi:hypothetical protein